MRFVCFHHSPTSEHGGAHFLRGYTTELRARGHEVAIYEQESELDLEVALDGIDVAIVHDSTDRALVARIGRHRASARHYTLLFHDTHHRSITAASESCAYDLHDYDGVLAFGRVLRDRYVERGWAARAWTWHEAADVRVFAPQRTSGYDGDVVWLGNWSDDERGAELRSMLIEPVASLRLYARVYGPQFPRHARLALEAAGIEYRCAIPNAAVPFALSRFRTRIHIPSHPHALPGVPTMRVFESLACGIPLISAPWSDDDHLFEAGRDYLVARDGDHVRQLLSIVIQDRSFAAALAAHGRKTILARHTCAHRVDELLAIVGSVQLPVRRACS